MVGVVDGHCLFFHNALATNFSKSFRNPICAQYNRKNSKLIKSVAPAANPGKH